MYHASGKTFEKACGSRAQVWHKTAHHTSGGLTRKNLIKNKWGKIVSASKSKTAKRQKRLEKAGWFATKGNFGAEKRELSRKRRGTRKA